MKITEWFSNGMDYGQGVALYEQLPAKKIAVMRQLNQGYSKRNHGLLITELRKNKTAKQKPIAKPKPVLTTKAPEKPVHELVEDRHRIQQRAEQSFKIQYGSIKYNTLPPELKVRYRENNALFYQKCDLKAALNAVPPEAEADAEKLVFAIDDIDTKQQVIWKELEYWNQNRKLLPTEGDNLGKFSPAELIKKKSNVRSQITKLEGRIEGYYDGLFAATDNKQKKSIEQQIERSEKRLHKHRLTLIEIDKLI